MVCLLACECALSGKLSVLHKHTHTLTHAVPFLHLSICANVRDAIKLNLVINQPQLAGFLLLPPLNLFPLNQSFIIRFLTTLCGYKDGGWLASGSVLGHLERERERRGGLMGQVHHRAVATAAASIQRDMAESLILVSVGVVGHLHELEMWWRNRWRIGVLRNCGK